MKVECLEFSSQESIEYTEDKFLLYIWTFFCKCDTSCIGDDLKPDYKNLVKNLPGCDYIEPIENIDIIKCCKSIIQSFRHMKILDGQDKLFIRGDRKRKLSWINIKKIKTQKTAIMLWLFRKCIVDTIIGGLIYEKDVKAFSVGSNKVTSDYDISLSGVNTDTVYYIIKEFKNIVYNLFGTTSDIVFDTNLYGTSFVSFDNGNNTNYSRYVCNSKNLFYVKQSNEYREAQFIWASLHYYSVLAKLYQKDNIGYIWDKLVQDCNNSKIILIIPDIYDFLETLDMSYLESLNNFDTFTKLSDSKLYNYTEWLSFVNYHASEAYFTRGAFLDVVVNQQTCKNKGILLTSDEYIQSIIENASFYIDHASEKYINRIESASKMLDDELISEYILPGVNPIASPDGDKFTQNILVENAYNKSLMVRYVNDTIYRYYKTLDETKLESIPIYKYSNEF